MPLMDGIYQLGNRCPIETGATFEDAPGSSPGAVAGLVLHGHQPGHRVAMARDVQAFASCNTVEQLGQMCLGFAGS